MDQSPRFGDLTICLWLCTKHHFILDRRGKAVLERTRAWLPSGCLASNSPWRSVKPPANWRHHHLLCWCFRSRWPPQTEAVSTCNPQPIPPRMAKNIIYVNSTKNTEDSEAEQLDIKDEKARSPQMPTWSKRGERPGCASVLVCETKFNETSFASVPTIIKKLKMKPVFIIMGSKVSWATMQAAGKSSTFGVATKRKLFHHRTPDTMFKHAEKQPSGYVCRCNWRCSPRGMIYMHLQVTGLSRC